MFDSKYLSQWLLLSVFFLMNGCGQPSVEGDHYTLDECKKELLEADDFDENQKIDHIVVVKKERKMYLYRNGKVQSTFPVSLGKNPVGHKMQKGDNRTPEGEFWIHRKLCSPKYYRSLCISYPRPEDVEAAQKRGVDPGGSITNFFLRLSALYIRCCIRDDLPVPGSPVNKTNPGSSSSKKLIILSYAGLKLSL